MLCVCVADVMDVVFSVLYCDAWCRCSCVGSVSGLCASCGSSQCCVLHNFQFVNAAR